MLLGLSICLCYPYLRKTTGKWPRCSWVLWNIFPLQLSDGLLGMGNRGGMRKQRISCSCLTPAVHQIWYSDEFRNFPSSSGKIDLSPLQLTHKLFWATAFCMCTFKNVFPGLPWWHSGWESACRGHGFEPWSGRIPHAAEQLGPWATATEPAHLEPLLRNKRGHDSERPAHRDEEWPLLAATRESPRTETKTQHSQK